MYTVTSGHTTAGADVWASRPPDAPGSPLEPPEKGGDASENIQGGASSSRVCRMHRKDEANGKKPRLAVRSPEFACPGTNELRFSVGRNTQSAAQQLARPCWNLSTQRHPHRTVNALSSRTRAAQRNTDKARALGAACPSSEPGAMSLTLCDCDLGQNTENLGRFLIRKMEVTCNFTLMVCVWLR